MLAQSVEQRTIKSGGCLNNHTWCLSQVFSCTAKLYIKIGVRDITIIIKHTWCLSQVCSCTAKLYIKIGTRDITIKHAWRLSQVCSCTAKLYIKIGVRDITTAPGVYLKFAHAQQNDTLRLALGT